jgi:hypothetical protein
LTESDDELDDLEETSVDDGSPNTAIAEVLGDSPDDFQAEEPFEEDESSDDDDEVDDALENEVPTVIDKENDTKAKRWCGGVRSGSFIDEYLKKIRKDVTDEKSEIRKRLQDGFVWVEPPCPTATVYKNYANKAILTPDPFYVPRVYLFFPHITHPYINICCPKCRRPVIPNKFC